MVRCGFVSDALFLHLTAENPVILPGIDKSKAYISTSNTQYLDDEEEFMYTEVLSNYGDLLVSSDVFVLRQLYSKNPRVRSWILRTC